MKKMIIRLAKGVIQFFHVVLTFLWKKLDKMLSWPDFYPLYKTVPLKIFGGIGGDGYTGWVFQQGFFSALMKSYANGQTSHSILDFGCGLGKALYPCRPLLGEHGIYYGVDIIPEVISKAASRAKNDPQVVFHLSQDSNARYNVTDNVDVAPGSDWPMKSESIDIAVAFSVFTHLQRKDAEAYLDLIHTKLKASGKAILTFHILDTPEVPNKPKYQSKMLPFLTQIFSFKYDLGEGFYTSDIEIPETAIGIDIKVLKQLLDGKFKILNRFYGSTTGGDDLFPQDILILEKI